MSRPETFGMTLVWSLFHICEATTVSSSINSISKNLWLP